MSEWKQKRFWKEVSVEDDGAGFAVALDGRRVKTPAKTALVVPTRALAEAIAAEWDAQDEQIDPLSMPYTRSANAAIDKVAVQFAEVADMLAEYGDSDLLCYRAESPEGLVQRQSRILGRRTGLGRSRAGRTPVAARWHPACAARQRCAGGLARAGASDDSVPTGGVSRSGRADRLAGPGVCHGRGLAAAG